MTNPEKDSLQKRSEKLHTETTKIKRRLAALRSHQFSLQMLSMEMTSAMKRIQQLNEIHPHPRNKNASNFTIWL